MATITAEEVASILIADLRAVHRIDPGAPLIGARICAAAVPKIEHVYIVTGSPMVRVVASAAASSIGLRFTCQAELPTLEAQAKSE